MNACRYAIVKQSEAHLHSRHMVHFKPSFQFFQGSGSESSDAVPGMWQPSCGQVVEPAYNCLAKL